MRAFFYRAGVICLVAACSQHAFAQAKTQESNNGSKVQLVTRDGALSAIVDSEEVSLVNLKARTNDLVVNGVHFRTGANGGIQILSSANSVTIGSPEAKGWRAEMPQNVVVDLNADLKNSQMDFSMLKTSVGTGFIHCDDGSQIELGPGAKGHLDVFQNGSFVFKGSGNISAVDGDGHGVDLSVPGATMTGAPLQLIHEKAEGGQDKSHWERPPVANALTIEGLQDGKLKISGDAGASYTAPCIVKTPTGSVEFKQNEDGSIDITGGKGKFTILVSGVPGFMLISTAGQKEQLTYDKTKKLGEVKNTGSEPIQTALPGRSVAVIEPKAEFQYALVAKGIFSSAAAGGKVTLYNGDGVSIGTVETGGMLLDAKKLTAGLTSGSGIRMHLNWDNGQPLQAASTLAFAEIQPGSERIVSFGNDGKAKLTYSSGGFMTVEALRSNFQLVIDAVHGMTISLVEGDKVSLTLDLKKGTFTLKTGADNVNDVSVETENGYSPILQADRALNFNIGDLNGYVIAANGEINPNSPTSPFQNGLLPPSPDTPITIGLIPPGGNPIPSAPTNPISPIR